MRNDRHLAIKLRRKGKSYRFISKEVGISKSTLSQWFSCEPWSCKIRDQLAVRARRVAGEHIGRISKQRWETWREAARQKAKNSFPKLRRDPLFVAGLMLYWGEGDSKPENPVRLSNTDPRLISLYVRFLKKALRVAAEKLRVTMILYPDLKETTCRAFWSDITGLPSTQFYKTQYIKGRHPTTRLAHGICMITAPGRQLKEGLLIWIDLASKTL